MPNIQSQPGERPPWGGIHALVSTAEVPLMRVGFLYDFLCVLDFLSFTQLLTLCSMSQTTLQISFPCQACLCAGRYLSDSGVEDALIECEVFGKKTLSAVFSGSHYVRSFQGMLIVSQILETLAQQAFWQYHSSANLAILESVNEFRQLLMSKNLMTVSPNLILF